MKRPVTPRRTQQRAAVAELLATLRRFHTAQEIHAMLRTRGRTVGLATVYRNLQAMAESGELDVVRTPDGQSAYRICGDGHHHHLICRSCGRTEEVDLVGVEAILNREAQAHGFTDVDHELEMFGLCGDCADA